MRLERAPSAAPRLHTSATPPPYPVPPLGAGARNPNPTPTLTLPSRLSAHEPGTSLTCPRHFAHDTSLTCFPPLGAGARRGGGGARRSLRRRHPHPAAAVLRRVTQASGGPAPPSRLRGERPCDRSRRRWLLALPPASGTLTLDAGACKALARGNSLFFAGVSAVTHPFCERDAVRVLDSAGRELARAVVNYGSEACAALAGRQSREIFDELKYHGPDELAHRRNIVLLTAAAGEAVNG